jgi:hypothetical protein
MCSPPGGCCHSAVEQADGLLEWCGDIDRLMCTASRCTSYDGTGCASMGIRGPPCWRLWTDQAEPGWAVGLPEWGARCVDVDGLLCT